MSDDDDDWDLTAIDSLVAQHQEKKKSEVCGMALRRRSVAHAPHMHAELGLAAATCHIEHDAQRRWADASPGPEPSLPVSAAGAQRRRRDGAQLSSAPRPQPGGAGRPSSVERGRLLLHAAADGQYLQPGPRPATYYPAAAAAAAGAAAAPAGRPFRSERSRSGNGSGRSGGSTFAGRSGRYGLGAAGRL